MKSAACPTSQGLVANLVRHAQMYCLKHHCTHGHTLSFSKPYTGAHSKICVSAPDALSHSLTLSHIVGAGCHPVQVPVATKMVIARICIPQIVLLTMPASAKEKDKGHPVFPPAGAVDPAEHVLDRLDRTAEAETSGSGLDDAQEGEQLVRQLQAYFQKHTRYLPWTAC